MSDTKITTGESIALLLMAEPYLIGANYVCIYNNINNYHDALVELKKYPTYFKLYTLDNGVILICNIEWLDSLYRQVIPTNTDFKAMYASRIESQKSKLQVLLHKFLHGQAPTTLVSVDNGFIELKVGVQTLKKIDKIRYEDTKLYSFNLSILECMNIIITTQLAYNKPIYIRCKVSEDVVYRDLSQFTQLSSDEKTELIHEISRGLEPLTTGLSTILTLRVPLTNIDRHFIHNTILD